MQVISNSSASKNSEARTILYRYFRYHGYLGEPNHSGDGQTPNRLVISRGNNIGGTFRVKSVSDPTNTISYQIERMNVRL